MKIVNDINKATCITHNGTMHADEIFATAFLDLYLKNIKVYRTSELPKKLKKTVIVYDIGRGIYDHHQEGAKKRDNGITYCSFGLLWQAFGKDFLLKRNIKDIDEVFTAFDKDIVEGIDADDNGIFPKIDAPYKVKTLSDVFKLFNPSYKANQNETKQFIKAVEFAKAIIEEALLNIIGKTIAKNQVLDLLRETENHTLYLNEYMPYEQTLLQEENGNDIFFVVYPSNRGGYCIKTVPKSQEDHTKRKDFPIAWAGLVGTELEKVSGIKGLKFCHQTRFLISCDTIDTAKEAIEKTLNESSDSSETKIVLDKNA